MRLTFTCTAMPRSEIFQKSIDSLYRNLVGCAFHQSSLIINIDPMIDAGLDDERARCMRIAERYFGNVVPNCPSFPNFALAVRWVWLKATDEFIVHWEDDWELLTRVDARELITRMRMNSLDHILLRAWRWRNYPFCLGPGLLRRQFYRRYAGLIAPELNPEMAIRTLIEGAQYSQYVHPPTCDHVIVRDLGRPWMRESSYVRGEGDFVIWKRRAEDTFAIDDRLADQNAEVSSRKSVSMSLPLSTKRLHD